MPNRLELWTGIECSLNPAGKRYHEQVRRSGFTDRSEDLELLAQLGCKTIRYCISWERLARDGTARIDWSATDRALQRMQALNITPIIGLMHHGAGPSYTCLEDDRFPEKLAEFARLVAVRYPWVTHYSPINDPLLTARFAGLYGLWHVQKRDGLSFSKMMLNQCRAIVCAIRAIREVVPEAKLVQTEDIGRTYSTPRLAYQAEFENERRWLTFDLLCGRVFKGHTMHHHLRWLGMTLWDLDWFLNNPCPPDIFGLNYHLASQRYLDENCANYPTVTDGGNEREPYVDVEAVHVLESMHGVSKLLDETWDRYRKPMALTEVCIGGACDDQQRWLVECWKAAQEANQGGQTVRAVTAWGFFGTYDRSALLRKTMPSYEPGAYDVRTQPVSKTPLAEAIRSLAINGRYESDIVREEGWWHKPERLSFASAQNNKLRAV